MTTEKTLSATTNSSASVPSGDQSAPAGDPGLSSWFAQVSTLARCELLLAMRSRWLPALIGLFVLFGGALVTFSGSAVGPGGAERILASLTSLSIYLIPLAALLFGYDALVERRGGWLELLFSLPGSRARTVVGIYAGRLAALSTAIVIGFGLVGLMVANHQGTAHWDAFVGFLIAAVMLGAAFLGLAFLASAICRDKTHALGVVLLMWVWFVFAHDLLALGAVAAFDLSSGALTTLVAANPTASMRVLVLDGLGASSEAGFSAAFGAANVSATVLVASLLGWAVVSVAAAAWWADRRFRLSWPSLRRRLRVLIPVAVVWCAAASGGCFGESSEKTPHSESLEPTSLDDNQTCDVCGMLIEGAGKYGPNGQVFFDGDHLRDDDGPAHYDSVREMYVDIFTQHRRNIEAVAVFVTDYSAFDYDVEERRGDSYITGSLDAKTFVSADDVVFVVGSDVRGAMGEELLPFSERGDATHFVEAHGGRIVEAGDVTAELVDQL